ncbi:MAG: hemerythrin family protein [Planctomycetes bacterium]|nr:hemerythrin family protein [Planctomycetota bacterium]
MSSRRHAMDPKLDSLQATQGRLILGPELESGHELLDREHRELFALGNAALEALARPDSSRPAVHSALDALVVHLVRHFTDEERVLAQCGYEHLEEHRRAHKALLARAHELEMHAEAGTISITELAEYLAHDVVQMHLVKTDRLFFPSLRAQR